MAFRRCLGGFVACPHTDMSGRSTWLDRAGPSWLVAALIYTGFGLVTWYYAALPWWLAAASVRS